MAIELTSNKDNDQIERRPSIILPEQGDSSGQTTLGWIATLTKGYGPRAMTSEGAEIARAFT